MDIKDKNEDKEIDELGLGGGLNGDKDNKGRGLRRAMRAGLIAVLFSAAWFALENSDTAKRMDWEAWESTPRISANLNKITVRVPRKLMILGEMFLESRLKSSDAGVDKK